MGYSQTGIVNLGLLRIGANIIADIDEGSANSIKAKAIWDYVFDELMQARDWRFAKTRAKLAKSSTSPLYAYQFAYPLPPDFLRLVKPKESSSRGINPVAYPSGYGYNFIDASGYSRFFNYDPPVYPSGLPYIIEALDVTDGQTTTTVQCLFTDYDNSAQDLCINYIRRIVEYTLCTPTFINCLANRIGAELAVPITEDKQKAAALMGEYKDSLNSAAAVNESLDYLDDEAGGQEWENAGR
jgi:hypothetical protein